METLAQASKQQGSKYQIEIADLEACIKEEQAALAKIGEFMQQLISVTQQSIDCNYCF